MSFGSFLSGILIQSCARCGEPAWTPCCRTCQDRPAAFFRTEGGLATIALGLYSGESGRMVHALKYSEETILASHLGASLAPLLPPKWRHCALAPVPLHPDKLAERGFNQAALLARRISRERHMLLEVDALYRVRATKSQARLNRDERTKNLQGAFLCNPSLGPRPLVLVDDVVTTGNTVDACAKALKLGGFDVVGVVACALARISSA